ncbi:nuclear transport factor 2 family protein [Nocardioides mangrovi]|uniref:Nuclear transport factor 2 family protein n=1 Tax=Nocardioides mangrovi TaxID=2874580 RepID=A0ABS7UAS9_9ACTN|nr:nuclear transport factor 2 family protein [Nocardioides mangrovi]MBZ5738099.1 nuclear transport factor 2 family protein [Nocardioides mangrovi]
MAPVHPTITRYFERGGSSTPDADGLAELFTDDAVVVDDGTTWTGRDGVRAWKTRTASEFTYATTVTGARADGAAIVVTGHLVGDFPGGEVDLTYTFTLAGDLIARLEIAA